MYYFELQRNAQQGQWVLRTISTSKSLRGILGVPRRIAQHRVYLMSYGVDCARNVEFVWSLLQRIEKSLERVVGACRTEN